MITAEQARDEIEALLASVGMSREELEKRGKVWDLNGDERGVLADIRGLEFLIEHASD